MTKVYSVHVSEPPVQIEADNPEEAVVYLREALKDRGVYLDVPLTVKVTAEDFEQDITV